MSTRGTILNTLATALAGITTANGYNLTVNEVTRDVPHSNDLPSENPTVTIIDTGPDVTRQYCGSAKVRARMRVTLAVSLSGASRGASPTAVVDSIIADVRKLILAPVSLGANCRYVEIVDIPRISIGDRVAAVQIDLDIDYWYTGTAP